MSNNSNSKPYWASVPSDEISSEMLDRVDRFYGYLTTIGRLSLYQRSWSQYYRASQTGGALGSVGTQGEYTSLSINQYANLLRHLEVMTTEQRPVFEPKATNSDVKSQSQVILAAGLLDYYMREKRLERIINQAVKDSLIFGEAFVRCEWNSTSGELYNVNELGTQVYEGDIVYTNYVTLDVVRDFTKNGSSQDDWFILRDFQNKYTLAAKFPDLADDILSQSEQLLDQAQNTRLNATALEESDNIAVYTLIHKKTPALPNGRFATCLDNGTVMLDGPIPYRETHVYRIAPDEQSGSPFGYTVGFDLLPIQETLDMLYSTAATNLSTFGVQNILVPKGHDLSTTQMAGGLNVMEYDPKLGKPEPLQLTNTAPETYNFMQLLERLGETISGVNATARGNPEASLQSGAALALIQSQAIQFASGLQQSYAQLVEDIGSGTIKLLQDFADVPRVAEIAGKSNRPLMKQFTGGDLDAISRVMVDMGSPLTRTTAGKVNLAEQLMKFNLIDNPSQFIQVCTTGRIEPVIEGRQAETLLIKAENEQLADGIAQKALITDQHAQHILEHKIVLASPEMRLTANLPIVEATLAHIQEHIDFLKTADPALLALMNQQSIAQAPQQGGGMGDMMNPTPPVQQIAEGVRMPNMPSPPVGTDPVSAGIIEANKG